MPFAADGLTPLMEDEMRNRKQSREGGGGGHGGKTVKTKHVGEGAVAVSQVELGESPDYLLYTVKLLGGLRWDGMERLESMPEDRMRISVYRAVRTQKFLEFTEEKIRERERAMQEVRKKEQGGEERGNGQGGEGGKPCASSIERVFPDPSNESWGWILSAFLTPTNPSSSPLLSFPRCHRRTTRWPPGRT
jgi:hypothetical protein